VYPSRSLLLVLAVLASAALNAAPNVRLKNDSGKLLYLRLDSASVPGMTQGAISIAYEVTGKENMKGRLEVQSVYHLLKELPATEKNLMEVTLAGGRLYRLSIYENNHAAGTTADKTKFPIRTFQLDTISSSSVADADATVTYLSLSYNNTPDWKLTYHSSSRELVISK
jgi:hypothetical protein